MTRKKKKQAYTPCFLFTPETIKVTQEALKAFEQPLGRADHQHPRVQFAEETMQQVRSKLDAMSTPTGQMRLAAFDYNERIVITTAIQLYILDMSAFLSHPQNARKLRQCRQIAAYFAPGDPEAEKEGGGRYSRTRSHH